MMPRVLLLGASGLLGAHLAARLPASFPTFATPGRRARSTDPNVTWLKEPLEATDAASVEVAVASSVPDIIVNAVGVTPGAAAQSDSRLLDAVNVRFPHVLASTALRYGARVVQISSDAVFSGGRGEYREIDPPDPSDAYGRSKFEGELAAPHLTLRTSFFGRSEGARGLVDWLVAQRGRTVEGFADYRFTGLAAALLAELIALAIALPLEGVYHVGGEPITKHDLLTLASRELGLDVTVTPVRKGAVDRTLDSSRFFTAINRPRPTVAESLALLGPCRALSRS